MKTEDDRSHSNIERDGGVGAEPAEGAGRLSKLHDAALAGDDRVNWTVGNGNKRRLDEHGN